MQKKDPKCFSKRFKYGPQNFKLKNSVFCPCWFVFSIEHGKPVFSTEHGKPVFFRKQHGESVLNLI